jgi:pimeloyl-ACP methyl ester carboxylesterase
MTLSTPAIPDGATAFRLDLPRGHLAACAFGDADAPLVVSVPGLSSNQRSFDLMAPRLAAGGHRAVALDLRGRGRSDVTAPGTYGWEAHARDVLDAASALGAQSFDVVGHSMGGLVAMTMATLAGERLRRVVLIDIAGRPDADSVGPIFKGVERLSVEWPTAEAYLDGLRATGVIQPWTDFWSNHYLYELRDTDTGVISRTDRAAVLEDGAYGSGRDIGDTWPHLRMPVLLVRAAAPVLPGLGHLVPAAERDRFLAAVPTARCVEVDANHYGVVAHPDCAAAISDFLR